MCKSVCVSCKTLTWEAPPGGCCLFPICQILWGEIFQTYSDRYIVGEGELWRSHNLQGEIMFTVQKILCKAVHYLQYVFVFTILEAQQTKP